MGQESSRRHDPTLFAGTAGYFSRYRFPYPQELFDHLSQTFRFDGTGTALDLGCGPGLLTIRLAPHFKKVVAMDPDDEMLSEARSAANTAGVSNIEFVKGSSWQLPPATEEFRFAIMGQSFHWMDRDQVLKELHAMLEPQGIVTIVFQERHEPAEIRVVEEETVRQFLGDRRRAGQGYYEHPPETHETVLARSLFKMLGPWRYSYERTQTIDRAVGYVFSTSRASPRLLGDRADSFEAELRRKLLEAAPRGKFKLRVDVTALLGRKN